jgi:hypothetical protein
VEVGGGLAYVAAMRVWKIWGWVPFVAAVVALSMTAGCGDDDDENAPVQPEGNGRPPLRDGGTVFDAGPLDAGMSLEELGLDASTLASELSADEAQQFCRKLDDVTGLLGDVKKACGVEAYLLTYDVSDCMSIVKQCNTNKETVLGLELALRCSETPTELKGCDAPVDDVLLCATALGAFWSTRECEINSLADPGPTCTSDLASACPLLFGAAQ